MTYKHDDGRLILAEWGAAELGHRDHEATTILVDHLVRTLPMYGTKATGDRMVSNGHLGVDLIRVPAGEGFSPHTHPGDHLLIAIAGQGTVTVDGLIYPTRAGQVYMVEGAVPHAVGAITDHCILAVGTPHREIDAADRMTLTDYAAVAASFTDDLTCLVCDGTPTGKPDTLRSLGCPHVPAEAPVTKPLVVGLAPATANHEGWPAFVETEAGDRLAGLLDVAQGRLLEHVDTVNLSPEFIGDWQHVKPAHWAELADVRVRPMLSGRLVVACGAHVAEALGVYRYGPGTASVLLCSDDGQTRPASLVVTIPHPRSTTWADGAVVAATSAALSLAVDLARTGPAGAVWTQRDADAFNEAVMRIAAGTVDDRT